MVFLGEQRRRQIPVPSVRKNHYDILALGFRSLRNGNCRLQNGSGRNSSQNTFPSGKIMAHHIAFFSSNRKHFIIYGAVQNFRNEPRPDALDFMLSRFTAGQYRALAGLYRDNPDIGIFSFRYRPTPVIIPPVPTAHTKISTLPSMASQISGPVVS